jgi:hypothetical protein
MKAARVPTERESLARIVALLDVAFATQPRGKILEDLDPKAAHRRQLNAARQANFRARRKFEPKINLPGWRARGYPCFPERIRLEPGDALVGAWRFDLRGSGVRIENETTAHLSIKL